MTIAKNGLDTDRIRATKPGDCVTVDEYFAADPASRATLGICGRYHVSTASMEFSGFTLRQLADALSTMMDLYVLDRTGLDGQFNFALRPERDAARGDGRLIAALEELGLKIEQTKGPAEYLVIESAQRPKPDAPAADPPARARGAGR